MRPNSSGNIRIRRPNPRINHIDKINNLVAITIVRRKIYTFGNKLVHGLFNGIYGTLSRISVSLVAIGISSSRKGNRSIDIKGRPVLPCRILNEKVPCTTRHVIIGIPFLIKVVIIFRICIIAAELDIAKLDQNDNSTHITGSFNRNRSRLPRRVRIYDIVFGINAATAVVPAPPATKTVRPLNRR